MTPRNSSRIIGILLPPVAGAAAGLLAALLAFGVKAPAPAPERALAASSVETRAPTGLPGFRDEPTHTQIAALETKLSEMTPTDKGPEPSAPATPAPRSPEEARRAAESILASALQRHANEPLREKWAEHVRTALEADLTKLAEANPFVIDAIACRSRSCVVTLTWKSFQDAATASGSLLHRRYAFNCGIMVMMPEPEDPSLPYTAKLVYECQYPDSAMESS